MKISKRQVELLDRQKRITRPGLETLRKNTGETALSKSPGPTGGPIASNGDSVAPLRQQALDALQFAWKSLRRLEDLSDDPSESKAAGRAVKHVDKAFAELEKGGER